MKKKNKNKKKYAALSNASFRSLLPEANPTTDLKEVLEWRERYLNPKPRPSVLFCSVLSFLVVSVAILGTAVIYWLTN
jgi:hypothetical protein